MCMLIHCFYVESGSDVFVVGFVFFFSFVVYFSHLLEDEYRLMSFAFSLYTSETVILVI